ncbi:hypothetical protein QTP86_002319 [Hemibagrus guttatus]|nr:hypothetical protein QTP86_002319 [Hemibagrus guttatus]
MDVRLALVLCVLAGAVSAESATAKSRSCAAFRQFYTLKGFSMIGVPQAQISGEHLRVCPQGYTCCTNQIEEHLSNLSRKEFEDQVKDSGQALQVTLSSQYKSFDAMFGLFGQTDRQPERQKVLLKAAISVVEYVSSTVQ